MQTRARFIGDRGNCSDDVSSAGVCRDEPIAPDHRMVRCQGLVPIRLLLQLDHQHMQVCRSHDLDGMRQLIGVPEYFASGNIHSLGLAVR